MQQNVLKKNDELVVTIERYGINGEGIAIYKGVVIFVVGAMVGEEVLVHIINDKHSYLIAKLLKIIKSSKDRKTSPCPYYEKCGGCDLQHFPYDLELEFKRKLIEDTFNKNAGINVHVNEVIKSPNEYRYRNKFAFPVKNIGGKPCIGMYKKNSHDIVEIEDCLLQSENTKLIIKLFKEYLTENNISAYDEQSKKGIVKHVVVRENKDAFVMTIVVTDEKFNNFKPLILKLEQYFKKFGIVKNVNKLNNNVIFGNLDINIYGDTELNFEEFGIKYHVNNRSFYQVNDDVKNLIYQKIIDTIGTQNNIIDAYSGAGLLSSILAKNAQNVYGVEIVKESTENANNLKKINNLYNLTNINGDCAKIVPELSKKLNGDFSVVVDPPRKGLDKLVIDAFLNSSPKQIVYLSCNPATLARDIKLMSEKYDIEWVQPYDMFSKTANVETLVCLNLR